MSDDQGRLEMAVLRAARAIRSSFNARLKDLGVSVTAATLLTFLDEQGSLTQRELAELVQISAATAGTVIDGLVDRGLVERHGDPADRRVWRITSTAAAAPIVAEFRRIDADVRRELWSGLGRAERDQLAGLLERLEANATRAGAAPATTIR